MICHPKLQNAALSIVLAAGAALAMASGAEAARISYNYTGNPIECDDEGEYCGYNGERFTGGFDVDSEFFSVGSLRNATFSGSYSLVGSSFDIAFEASNGFETIHRTFVNEYMDFDQVGFAVTGGIRDLMFYKGAFRSDFYFELDDMMQVSVSSFDAFGDRANTFMHGYYGESDYIFGYASSDGYGVWKRSPEVIPLPPAALLLFTGVAALFTFRGKKAQA